MAIHLGDGVFNLKGDMTHLVATMGAARKKIGLGMTLVGTAIVAGLGKAVKSAATFEQAITNAASVTGKSGKEFEIARDKMAKLAKTLGRETAFSAKQAANAFYDLSSKGFDVANMSLSELRPILDLAAATQGDLSDATRVVTGTLRGFGLANQDMTRIADVFARAIGTSAAKMELFSTSMPIVSTAMKLLNLSFEESVAVLSSLYDREVDASTAATGLRNIMLDLLAKKPPIVKGFKAIGVSLDGIDIAGSTVVEVFRELVKRGLTAQQAMVIFGKKTGTVAGALTDAIGEIDTFTGSLQNAGGTANAVAKLQLDTLSGRLQILKGSIEGVGIELGEVFIPILKRLAERLIEITNAFLRWQEVHPGLFAVLTKLLALLGGGLVAGGLILAFGKLKIAIQAVTTALAFLTAHPIVALITIIAGALTYAIRELIKGWDDIVWALKEVGHWIVRTKDTFVEFITTIGAKIKEFLSGPFNWFKQAIFQMGGASWFHEIFNSMSASVNRWSKYFGQAMTAGLQSVKTFKSGSETIMGSFGFPSPAVETIMGGGVRGFGTTVVPSSISDAMLAQLAGGGSGANVTVSGNTFVAEKWNPDQMRSLAEMLFEMMQEEGWGTGVSVA